MPDPVIDGPAQVDSRFPVLATMLFMVYVLLISILLLNLLVAMVRRKVLSRSLTYTAPTVEPAFRVNLRRERGNTPRARYHHGFPHGAKHLADGPACHCKACVAVWIAEHTAKRSSAS